MDLSTLSASETAVIKLKHPVTFEVMTENGEPLTVTIYGPGSRQHQQMRVARERRQNAAMAAAFKHGEKHDQGADIDKVRTDAAIDLAACTAAISGWNYKGKTDADAIKAAYADASMSWLALQVHRALDDWASFLPESATA